MKPYMRYSIAGRYQSNGENWSGLGYCVTAADSYRGLDSIEEEIREAMDGWMQSPGHRRNVLDPYHKKVNIGVAWDRFNTAMIQHFEGDYITYERLPTITDGTLDMKGRTKNAATLRAQKELGIQIFYDQPPTRRTRGQLAQTYCYDNGKPVASLRWLLTDGSRWTDDTFEKEYKPCPSPYDFPADTPAPKSHDEAYRAWQRAYDASQARRAYQLTLPWVTASKWSVNNDSFEVKADISHIVNAYGAGVYSVIVWGVIEGQEAVISEYSIFSP